MHLNHPAYSNISLLINFISTKKLASKLSHDRKETLKNILRITQNQTNNRYGQMQSEWVPGDGKPDKIYNEKSENI